jgi:hypothetical protein
MPVRTDVVNDLVDGALKGMEAVGGDYSGAEFLSATFTMTLRVIKSTLERNPETLPTIKAAVETLFLQCADQSRPN